MGCPARVVEVVVVGGRVVVVLVVVVGGGRVVVVVVVGGAVVGGAVVDVSSAPSPPQAVATRVSASMKIQRPGGLGVAIVTSKGEYLKSISPFGDD
jgi:hypothetical protein